MASHHFSDDILLEYVTGRLPQHHALSVQTHLALCAHCTREIEFLYSVGGAMLNAITPVDITDNALAQTLQKLNQPEPTTNRQTQPDDILPPPIQDITGYTLDEIPWKKVWGGVKTYPIIQGNHSAYLLSIPPHKPMPHHTHTGMEMTLVLDGSFQDCNTYKRGDVCIVEGTHQHRPSTTEQHCICLITADGAISFSNPVLRTLTGFMIR